MRKRCELANSPIKREKVPYEPDPSPREIIIGDSTIAAHAKEDIPWLLDKLAQAQDKLHQWQLPWGDDPPPKSEYEEAWSCPRCGLYQLSQYETAIATCRKETLLEAANEIGAWDREHLVARGSGEAADQLRRMAEEG